MNKYLLSKYEMLASSDLKCLRISWVPKEKQVILLIPWEILQINHLFCRILKHSIGASNLGFQ